MARIPYPDLDAQPESAALQQQILRERNLQRMPNLYRMLLHSPPVAQGWLSLLTAIRQQCKLSGRVRELVILRIAVLNDADYEFTAHVPFGLREGLSQAQIDALREWPGSPLFDPTDCAVLAYTDAMTRDVHVPDGVFAPLRGLLDDRQVMELTATIAAYNLVSRFLEALQIDPEG